MSDVASIEHPAWLTGGDFTEADEPLRLFATWFAEAKRAEPVNPEAMTLATVDAEGRPNARMVLLKVLMRAASCFTRTPTAPRATSLPPRRKRR